MSDKSGKTVLIVDDEANIRSMLGSMLLDEGYKVLTAADGESAIQMIESEEPTVVLLDIWLPQMDGMGVLKEIKKNNSNIPVVMMSGHGTVQTAVSAVRLGAFDFLEKPLSIEKVLVTLSNVLKLSSLSNENAVLKKKYVKKYEMVGKSKQIVELKKRISLAAPTTSSVLIYGENGVGKELVAQEIHSLSGRRNNAFVELNCAAIPEELIESELFGHEKGSFTGAATKKRGKFDLASGGTLFLDEIGDMSLKTQAKILRILQEQVFERVGGTKPISVDVRVIAATNKNLLQEIKNGNFREDLYYRLNVIPFEVPPLRYRVEDIPILVEHFNNEFSAQNGKKPKYFTDTAMKKLCEYSWPGNIRELKNVIEHIIIMTLSDKVTGRDMPSSLWSGSKDLDSGGIDDYFSLDFRNARDRFEREYIIKKLKEFNGNISKTAENINVERSHLHKKMRQYEITN
jgi:two-component system, NtrC family, nitrogen regulation response regulator NtrX